MSERIDLGIIGGSGFYEFFQDTEKREIERATEYGAPAAPVTLTTWQGRRVGFLPRHGPGHRFLPHRVPYAANLAALRDLGARQVLGVNAVGSLSPRIGKGDFVLVDQFVDLTWGRHETIFEGPGGGHADLAEPYCPVLRQRAVAALSGSGEVIHPTATSIVINGPKFQTRAESKLYHSWGGDVINMTQATEAAIARELELCHVNVSYCTDYGVLDEETNPNADDEPVIHATIVEEFRRNQHRVEAVVRAMVAAFGDTETCRCRRAMEGSRPE